MATNRRGASVVGYNMQVAVDTQHHLIVAYQVTNVIVDRTLLAPMLHKMFNRAVARHAASVSPTSLILRIQHIADLHSDYRDLLTSRTLVVNINCTGRRPV